MATLKEKLKYKLKNEEKINYKICTINESALLIYHDDSAFSLPLLYFADNSAGTLVIQTHVVPCTRSRSLYKFCGHYYGVTFLALCPCTHHSTSLSLGWWMIVFPNGVSMSDSLSGDAEVPLVGISLGARMLSPHHVSSWNSSSYA